MQTDATDVRDPQRILTASLGEEVGLFTQAPTPAWHLHDTRKVTSAPGCPLSDKYGKV